jgi:hypothetical protein
MEKNLIRLGNVFLIGHKPDQMRNVIHLQADAPENINRSANIILKLLVVYEHPEPSRMFLWVHDDYVFLRPIRDEVIHNYHIGGISETIGPREPQNVWYYTLLKSEYILDAKRIRSPQLRRVYCPVKLHKDLFPLIFKKWEKYWASDIGVGFKTVFVCNLLKIEHRLMPEDWHIALERSENDFYKSQPWKSKRFLSFNDHAISSCFHHSLIRIFSYKCGYEK